MNKQRILIILILVALLPTFSIGGSKNRFPSSSYISYTGMIEVHSNSEFQSLATTNDWSGDGLSEETAYIIEDLNITGAPYGLVYIYNTDLFIKFRNCLLSWGGNPLFDAITLTNVQNAEFTGNTIVGNRHGVFIDNCSEIKFENNIIKDMWESGIRVNNSDNIQLAQNKISNVTYNGIWLNNSDNNILYNNIISDTYNAIWLRNGSSFNEIISNNIQDVANGIWLSNFSDYCNITLNFINNTLSNGIDIRNSTSETYISNNTIISCVDHGIVMDSSTSNNLIEYNSFVDTNLGGTSQALDNGIDNDFTKNYWNDWTTPDLDVNGYVDNPYALEGSASNFDELPLATPNQPLGAHIITPPGFISPVGGELVNQTLSIEWTNAYDSFGHDIFYNISYRQNYEPWNPVIEEISATSINWQVPIEVYGTGYQIKVLAYCIEGRSGYTISARFDILTHNLTAASVVFPLAEEVVNETISIQWTPAVDNFGHIVFYNISYKHNLSDWFTIAESITDTNISWNTSKVIDGTGYQIRIIAYCDYGLISITYSDIFTVDHTEIEPKPKFPWIYIISGIGGVAIVGLSVSLGVVIAKNRKIRRTEDLSPAGDTKVKSKSDHESKKELNTKQDKDQIKEPDDKQGKDQIKEPDTKQDKEPIEELEPKQN